MCFVCVCVCVCVQVDCLILKQRELCLKHFQWFKSLLGSWLWRVEVRGRGMMRYTQLPTTTHKRITPLCCVLSLFLFLCFFLFDWVWFSLCEECSILKRELHVMLVSLLSSQLKHTFIHPSIHPSILRLDIMRWLTCISFICCTKLLCER
jgi:hypothetical protein